MTKKRKPSTRIKSVALAIGFLSHEKLNRFLLIRQKFIEISNFFVEENYQPSFFYLDEFENPKKELTNRVLATQKSISKGFCNKTYIEKARINVVKDLYNQITQGKKAFLSAIHNIDKLKYHSPKDIEQYEKNNVEYQIYQYFDIDFQRKFSQDDLDFIKSEYKSVDIKQRIPFIKEIINGNRKQFSDIQFEIIQSLYQSFLERYSKPRYGINDDFTSMIQLDYRVIKDYKDKIVHLENEINLFIDKSNSKYQFFLEMSDPVLHGKKIKIPLYIDFKRFEQLYKQSKGKSNSFTIEIKHDKMEIKHIIEKESIFTDLQAQYDTLIQSDYLIGRDFGYKNTISLSVIKNDFKLSFDDFEKRMALKKESTELLYNSHFHHPEIIEQVHYSGEKFLNKIKIITKNIDNIKSVIDKGYNELETILFQIKEKLNLSENDFIDNKKTDNIEINQLKRSFFKRLNKLKKQKQTRRNLYKKIKGIKRTWFGFLSRKEIELTEKYKKAAFIVEDLTVMAAEKDKPEYKGRTFNKMINNGSKGQYMRMAQANLFWNGILEVRIPSFYSSTTCVKHSLVNKKMRKGENFKCPECGRIEHADEHASATIPSFLLLKPLVSM